MKLEYLLLSPVYKLHQQSRGERFGQRRYSKQGFIGNWFLGFQIFYSISPGEHDLTILHHGYGHSWVIITCHDGADCPVHGVLFGATLDETKYYC